MNKEINIESVEAVRLPCVNGRNPYPEIPAKIIKCNLMSLFPAVYCIGGVKYEVESRYYVPGCDRPTAEKSFGKALLAESERLTETLESDTINAENMCSASANKEVKIADE